MVGYSHIDFFSDVGSAPNLMEFLTKIGGMMLRLGFGVALLNGGAMLAFDYVVNPVLTDAANLASTVLSKRGFLRGANFPVAGERRQPGRWEKAYANL